MIGNPLLWLVWVASTAALTMLVRNPLYHVILLLVSRIVATAAGRQENRGRQTYWIFSATIILVSSGYSALFVHIGRHVLVRLPSWPLIGGSITLESLVTGAANGLMLVTLLSIFLTLGELVPTSQLVRLTPAALADAGLILMIALNYFPQTKRHFEKVREAQLIRGNRLQSIKDWRPLMVPLLIGGLERSMNLAEAMAARGIGSTTDVSYSKTRRGLMTLALGLTLTGGMIVPLKAWFGYLVLASGLLIAGALLWSTNKRITKRTVYSPIPRSPISIATGVLGLIAISVVIFASWINIGDSLVYTAYPSISWPAFDWRIGLLLSAMTLPALKWSQGEMGKENSTSSSMVARK